MITDPTLESQEAMTAKTLSVPPVERSGGSDTPYPAIANIPFIRIDHTGDSEILPAVGEELQINDYLEGTVTYTDNIDRLPLRQGSGSMGTPAHINVKVKAHDAESQEDVNVYFSGIGTYFRTDSTDSLTVVSCVSDFGAGVYKLYFSGTARNGELKINYVRVSRIA